MWDVTAAAAAAARGADPVAAAATRGFVIPAIAVVARVVAISYTRARVKVLEKAKIRSFAVYVHLDGRPRQQPASVCIYIKGQRQ